MWSDAIKNVDLYKSCKIYDEIENQAFDENPQGMRKHERHRITSRVEDVQS